MDGLFKDVLNLFDLSTRIDSEDYISLTDIARYKDTANTDDIIKNWLRNRNTIELLGFCEQLYNPDFKPVEFDGLRSKQGSTVLCLLPKNGANPPMLLVLSHHNSSMAIKIIHEH